MTLPEKLAVCQQVARLVRSKLPLAGELARSAKHASSAAKAARSVDEQLMAGKSLSDALAGEPTRDSRVLAACIEVGEQSGSLEKTLEVWTEYHLACSRYARTLRGALLYPVLLIIVMLCSLGFVVWVLIPEYQQTYAQFDAQLPSWLSALVSIRAQMRWLMVGLVLAAVVPLLWWARRRRSFDRWGQPRERAARAQSQALATELLQIGVGAGVPLSRLIPYSVQASGGQRSSGEQALAGLRRQQPIPQLCRETTLLMASLHGGLISAKETAEHLKEVASFLRQQADDSAASAARWLPMFVALVVGGLTLLTYVCLIYLPWILLLQRIATPD
ncbi:MAG: type II secretion system F family protein [Planctomycetales bacterium]|nr:type II secretion system F family protein [Planctomycetales bacterium]